jgi:hypothetical protein
VSNGTRNRMSFGTSVSLLVLWPLTAVTAGAEFHGAIGLLALIAAVTHVALHWKALKRLAKTSFRKAA